MKKIVVLKIVTLCVLLPLCALLCISCVTSLQDMKISDIEMSIEDNEGNEVERLLPDSIYSLDFRVTDTSGESYLNPNYKDFRFDGPRHMKIVEQARFNVKARTSVDTFHPPGEALYGFVLKVEDNPFPPHIYTFDLHWEAYDTLDFSGADGEAGESGERGSSASGESVTSVTGASGEDGADGKRGLNGRDVRLVVMKYLHGDRERILYYEPETDLLFLTDLKTITLDTRGGEGGRGGSGGDGGSGKEYYDEVADETTTGIAGSPGDGGDGGDGGNGGDIELLAADPQLFNYLRPLADGGHGGTPGGAGRSSSPDGSNILRGDHGKPGRDGWDGEVRFRTLSQEELRRFIDQISREGFNPAHVL